MSDPNKPRKTNPNAKTGNAVPQEFLKLSQTPEGRRELMQRAHGAVFEDGDDIDSKKRDRNLQQFFATMSREDATTFMSAFKGDAAARTEIQKRYRSVAADGARADRLARAADRLGSSASDDIPPAATAPVAAPASHDSTPEAPRATGRHRASDIDNDGALHDAPTLADLPVQNTRRPLHRPDPAQVASREQAARALNRLEDTRGSNYFDYDPLVDGPKGSESAEFTSDDDELPDQDVLRGGDRRTTARRRRERRNVGVGAHSHFDTEDTAVNSLAGLTSPDSSGEFAGDDAVTTDFAAIPRSARSRGFWRRVGDFARSASSLDRTAGRGLKAAGQVANGLVGLGIVAGFQKLTSRSEKWRDKFDSMTDDERAKYERRVGLWTNIGAIAAGTYFLVTKTHITDSMPWVSDITGHGHGGNGDNDNSRLIDATHPPQEHGNGAPAPTTPEVPPASPRRNSFGLFQGYNLPHEDNRDRVSGNLDFLVDFNGEDPATRTGKEHINDFNVRIPLADSSNESSVEAMLKELGVESRGNPQEMASFLGDARIEGAPWREHYATQQDYANALQEYSKLLEHDEGLREKQYNLLADKFTDSATTFKKETIDRPYGAWYINHETGELEWDDYVDQGGEMSVTTFADGTKICVRECGQTVVLHEAQPHYEESYVPPVPYYPQEAEAPYIPQEQPQYSPEPEPEYVPEPAPAPAPEPAPAPPAQPPLPLPWIPHIDLPELPQLPVPDGSKQGNNPSHPNLGVDLGDGGYEPAPAPVRPTIDTPGTSQRPGANEGATTLPGSATGGQSGNNGAQAGPSGVGTNTGSEGGPSATGTGGANDGTVTSR